MMEVLVGVCLISVGVLWGASLYFQKVMENREKTLQGLIEAQNKNLAEFVKAYADFQSKCLAMEQRLASLEFKITGVTQSVGGKR